jgi:hypothetical protein
MVRSLAVVCVLLGFGLIVASASAAIQASFSCSPSCSVTTGTTVTFTSTSSSSSRITNYEWDLDGDGLYGASDDPDERSGPDASSAQRSFPSSGSYTIGLRVTNLDRETSTARKTVTVTAPPPPQGLRRVPTSFTTDKLSRRYSLGKRRLARLVRKRAPRRGSGADQLPGSEFEFPAPQIGCLQLLCSVDSVAAQSVVTPLVGKPFGTGGGIDPQVAASRSYLVIGKRDTVYFYDKAGNQLTARGPDNKPVKYTVPLCSLFRPLIPHINAELDKALPHQLKDIDGNAISVQNGYGINCDKATGGVKPAKWSLSRTCRNYGGFYWPSKMFFDARVLWDEYHKRFWIVSLILNGQAKQRYACGCKEGNCPPASEGTYNAGRALHGLLALAVSKTGDPRDGWNESWAWGYPGQDSCPNNECPYVGNIDYLSAGITSKHLLLEYKAVDGRREGKPQGERANVKGDELIAGEPRRQVTVIPTDPALANLGKAAPVYSNPLPLTDKGDIEDGGTKLRQLEPAVQHSPDLGNGDEALFVTKYGNEDKLLLWLLSFDGGQPTNYQLPVSVRKFRGVKKGELTPQKTGSPIALAGSIQIPISKVVYRNASIYVTFDECSSFTSSTCLRSALRFVRIGVNALVKGPGGITQLLVDKPFDVTYEDPQGAWQVFPALEVNKDDSAAFVFQRSGAGVSDPEARYSVYYKGEPQLRPSALLRGAKAANKDGWHHYVGMAVDPYNKTGIWMIDGATAKSGKWNFVVGKVLGKAQPNLGFEYAIAKIIGGGPGKRRRINLTLRLGNLGDGSARANKAAIYLTRRRGAGSSRARKKQILLKRIRIGRLRPGRAKTIKLTLRLPARRRGYRYLRINLDAQKKLKEYGEGDNSAYVRLPKRSRRR